MRMIGGCVCGWVLGIAAVSTVVGGAVKQQGDSWTIETEAIRLELDSRRGTLAVTDKAGGYSWRQPPGASHPGGFRNVKPLPAPISGLIFEADFGATEGRANTLRVSIEVSDASNRILITLDMPDRHAEAHAMPFLEPFLLDTPCGVLAVADYCNGHVYPVDDYPDRQTYGPADRMDMPWVGLCDLDRGFGWLMIVDTSDNADIHFKHYAVGDRKLAAPKIIFVSNKRKFSYPRRLIYEFLPKGGYVALAKSFREYARRRGLLVTLAEKAKHNPNVARLFGAPDIWGDASLAFAREAKAAGVDKMLIQGRSTPDQMRAINALGYLTSEYDNYTDIVPPERPGQIDSQHAPLPDSAVLNADGKRMTAWLTMDKKLQYMKRCPALWIDAARHVIPAVLRDYPYLGRFIDVTTAEGLYECFDPNHPLDKAAKRQCGVDLLAYTRSQNLVVGGEHGIWWAVPQLDYIEGMMSGSPWFYPWPAGHLIRPKNKQEKWTGPWGNQHAPWELYEKWSIGHKWRAPLWELVFHDCVISTWYWGDTNDYLLVAAPENAARKDAFNILYGTMPMMWAIKEGAWHANRAVFLRTYRNTCKLHEIVACAEMLTHEFVTPDHDVQRTRFSDGTEVIVNFGDKPYSASVAGKTGVLPRDGFIAKGPRIEQSLTLVNGKPLTTIKTSEYSFIEGGTSGPTR